MGCVVEVGLLEVEVEGVGGGEGWMMRGEP